MPVHLRAYLNPALGPPPSLMPLQLRSASRPRNLDVADVDSWYLMLIIGIDIKTKRDLVHYTSRHAARDTPVGMTLTKLSVLLMVDLNE